MQETTAPPLELGKLRWRCRRGMKELDLLLSRYVEQAYAGAAPDEQQAFRVLLEIPDPVLYAYFIGRERPLDPSLAALVESISAGP